MGSDWDAGSISTRGFYAFEDIGFSTVFGDGLLVGPRREEGNDSASRTAPTAAHPATPTAEDKARKNPIKFTEVSVARGKKIFGTQCALCHGDKGDGKGELAADMKLTVPNFTQPDTLKDRTDGELLRSSHGKNTMPAQGSRLSDDHRWNLVNYMRSLPAKCRIKRQGKNLRRTSSRFPSRPNLNEPRITPVREACACLMRVYGAVPTRRTGKKPPKRRLVSDQDQTCSQTIRD